MKIQISTVSYTKTSLQTAGRKIIAERDGKLLDGHAYEIAQWIYQQRVSTVLPSPLYFKIEEKGVYSGFIWSTDNREWFNMSFKKALLTSSQESTHNITKAFRHAVDDQIKAFRVSALAKNKTLARMAAIDPRSVHTDHVVPFHLLLADFLHSQRLVLSDVALDKHPYFVGDYVVRDKALVKEWQAFHHKHAQLKLMSASDNYTKANQFDLPLFRYQHAQEKTYHQPLTM